MVVVCLSKCPSSLRGDITRWLLEINVGVYVGNVSARVRDALWDRITANVKDGAATMVSNAKNEQHMEFRVHNSEWIPIDFDGLKLMLKPHTPAGQAKPQEEYRAGYSAAQAIHNAKKYGGRKAVHGAREEKALSYVVLDIETTGLSQINDRIIEIGAIRVENGQISDSYNALIKIGQSVPQSICELTGITDEMLSANGVDEACALRGLTNFICDLPIVMHNLSFDIGFLRRGCVRSGVPMFTNKMTDTATLARRSLDGIDNFRLATIADYFDIAPAKAHRSMDDCITTMQIYQKLIEKR